MKLSLNSSYMSVHMCVHMCTSKHVNVDACVCRNQRSMSDLSLRALCPVFSDFISQGTAVISREAGQSAPGLQVFSSPALRPQTHSTSGILGNIRNWTWLLCLCSVSTSVTELHLEPERIANAVAEGCTFVCFFVYIFIYLIYLPAFEMPLA